jgi:hypothetical protein
MGAAAIAIAPILLMPETAQISISHTTKIPDTEAHAVAV